MRKSVDEKLLHPDDTEENYNIQYSYDNFNRLVQETADDGSSNGYTADYLYNLVGNRLERAITITHNSSELYTDYEYDDQDRLIREEHSDTIPSAMIQREDGPYYAYITDKGVYYTKAGRKGRIGQFKAFMLNLPSVWSHYIFAAVMLLMVVVFLLPAALVLLTRITRRGPPRRSRIHLSLFHRSICLLLAYILLISPAGIEQLAHASTLYSQLGTGTWGQPERIIEYGHWDGGTPGSGNFIIGYDKNGSVIEKITCDTKGTSARSDDTKLEEITYEYNLQNRLAQVTTDDQSGTVNVVVYTYNDGGIRIRAYSYEMPQGGGAKSNEKTVVYLVDSYNHTVYAQVLEELTFNYADPDPINDTPDERRTYTIGDDVLTQAKATYDGGWTYGPATTTIVDAFSYDGYGVMLGGNPTNSIPLLGLILNTSIISLNHKCLFLLTQVRSSELVLVKRELLIIIWFANIYLI